MRGFTLIELLVTLAVIGIVGTLSAMTYNALWQSQKPRQASVYFGQTLREAQMQSRLMDRDSAWGVRIASSTIIKFSGTSYAARNTAYDSTTTIPLLITSGTTEVVFAKFTGLPSATGTTTFSNAFGTSTVTVFASGVIR